MQTTIDCVSVGPAAAAKNYRVNLAGYQSAKEIRDRGESKLLAGKAPPAGGPSASGERNFISASPNRQGCQLAWQVPSPVGTTTMMLTLIRLVLIRVDRVSNNKCQRGAQLARRGVKCKPAQLYTSCFGFNRATSPWQP